MHKARRSGLAWERRDGHVAGMEHSPAIWVQVVGGVWIALIGYHAFLWTLRRHFTSQTNNAMRWLAVSTAIGGVMFFWIYQVTG